MNERAEEIRKILKQYPEISELFFKAYQAMLCGDLSLLKSMNKQVQEILDKKEVTE